MSSFYWHLLPIRSGFHCPRGYLLRPFPFLLSRMAFSATPAATANAYSSQRYLLSPCFFLSGMASTATPASSCLEWLLVPPQLPQRMPTHPKDTFSVRASSYLEWPPLPLQLVARGLLSLTAPEVPSQIWGGFRCHASCPPIRPSQSSTGSSEVPSQSVPPTSPL